jgi:8-oxo-dGTP pyrophosphatase MutT (NUDIX family)
MHAVPAAKVLVRDPKDISKLLLITRYVNGTYYYEPAGGKVEVDYEQQTAETLEDCAICEAHEELGVSVSIDRYLGSYYFFWAIDQNKCSSCALFLARHY